MLNLSSNLLDWQVPDFVWNISSLRYLDLSNNPDLEGTLADNLNVAEPRLKDLLLGNASFYGSLRLDFMPLRKLHVQDNNFNSTISWDLEVSELEEFFLNGNAEVWGTFLVPPLARMR